ncbi:hypothetical protein ZOSMA_34G00050 [Zostera marina]|uniref:Uncharacterized protein n=1 Tax=Zostera marina TaxID=29655 RepID=A0A0K9P987_ZOSMR|nr:hypothetical protein ZOSMA_34G00050 [Zostera marina]
MNHLINQTSGNSYYEGKVISCQQKTKLSEKNGWLIEEVIAPQGDVPYGEYFNVANGCIRLLFQVASYIFR